MLIAPSINILQALMWRHERLTKTFHFTVKHRLVGKNHCSKSYTCNTCVETHVIHILYTCNIGV